MKGWLYIALIGLLTAGMPVAQATGVPVRGQRSLRSEFTWRSPLQDKFVWQPVSCYALAFHKRFVAGALTSPVSSSSSAAAAATRSQPWYFADKYVTHLTPHNSGTWRNTAQERVWRLALSSASAYSLYTTLQHLQLMPGVQLFVYNPVYKQVHGPYTAATLHSATVLAIPPVAGDKIVIELHVPHRLKTFGTLTLAAVYHDKLNLFAEPAPGRTPPAYTPPDCEQPVNCTSGAYWQTEKRAVCKIIADGALCTGTLLANTSRSSTPYVLTAYHVIFTLQHAQEAVFLFNYEYTTCGGTEISTTQSVSGSRLLATQQGSDAVLLLLNAAPPAASKPYYAGWDVQGSTLATPAVTIHHPWGRPKQIALTWQQVQTAGYGNGYAANAFWQCNWDVGVTQPGSSGAPLFNKQHRVVGTLTGGDATCGAGGSDYFFKMANAWKSDTSIAHTLQAWLDAAATGATTMDGYDPYGFDSTACGDAWNIAASEQLDSTPLLNTNTSLPYPATTPLAEQFLSPGSLLVSAVYLRIAALTIADATDYITLTLWEGDALPGRVVYQQNISLTKLHTGLLTLIPDSAIALQGNFFIGYVPHIHAASQLTLYRAASRGNGGPSTLYLQQQGWQAVQQLNNNMATSAGIGIVECYGKTRRPVYGNLRLYPNPCSNYLHFTLPGNPVVQKVLCFNSSGKPMPVTFQAGEGSHTLYFQLPAGVYYLQVRTAARVWAATFIATPAMR